MSKDQRHYIVAEGHSQELLVFAQAGQEAHDEHLAGVRCGRMQWYIHALVIARHGERIATILKQNGHVGSTAAGAVMLRRLRGRRSATARHPAEHARRNIAVRGVVERGARLCCGVLAHSTACQ